MYKCIHVFCTILPVKTYSDNYYSKYYPTCAQCKTFTSVNDVLRLDE